jgi:hypothetical protein
LAKKTEKKCGVAFWRAVGNLTQRALEADKEKEKKTEGTQLVLLEKSRPQESRVAGTLSSTQGNGSCHFAPPAPFFLPLPSLPIVAA